jgi:hypothetical protein
MAQWLERREKVQLHAAVIQGRLRATHDRNTLGSFPAKPIGPPGPGTRHLKMTRNPTKTKVFFEELAQDYSATYFQDALGDFIARLNHPGASMGTLNDRARNTLIPFRWVSVFHKVKFSHSDTSESDIVMSLSYLGIARLLVLMFRLYLYYRTYLGLSRYLDP